MVKNYNLYLVKMCEFGRLYSLKLVDEETWAWINKESKIYGDNGEEYIAIPEEIKEKMYLENISSCSENIEFWEEYYEQFKGHYSEYGNDPKELAKQRVENMMGEKKKFIKKGRVEIIESDDQVNAKALEAPAIVDEKGKTLIFEKIKELNDYLKGADMTLSGEVEGNME